MVDTGLLLQAIEHEFEDILNDTADEHEQFIDGFLKLYNWIVEIDELNKN